ncbi:MAG: transcriptional regulator [Maricaulis sp.]|nr:transcriptional regulator [Maricaulis sp.]
MGGLLYGAHWQAELARALDVSLRNVQYMTAGDRTVHDGIARDLLNLLREQHAGQAEAIAQLEAKLEG